MGQASAPISQANAHTRKGALGSRARSTHRSLDAQPSVSAHSVTQRPPEPVMAHCPLAHSTSAWQIAMVSPSPAGTQAPKRLSPLRRRQCSPTGQAPGAVTSHRLRQRMPVPTSKHATAAPAHSSRFRHRAPVVAPPSAATQRPSPPKLTGAHTSPGRHGARANGSQSYTQNRPARSWAQVEPGRQLCKSVSHGATQRRCTHSPKRQAPSRSQGSPGSPGPTGRK